MRAPALALAAWRCQRRALTPACAHPRLPCTRLRGSYGFDVGTKAGTPGGPFIEGMNEGVLGMQARCCAGAMRGHGA